MQLDTSLDRSNSGLGIGLTLARDLAVMHGGSIEAHSAGPGQGSEFVVKLELVSQSPPVPSPAVEPESASIAGLHILVVDDNVDSAASLTMLLELLGGVTQLSHDGIEALRMAEATGPDVMLLDIGLPGLNGYEVCRELRSHDWGRRMTAIALTGWGQSDDIQRSADAGFDGHLVKPLDLPALQQLLSGLGVHGVTSVLARVNGAMTSSRPLSAPAPHVKTEEFVMLLIREVMYCKPGKVRPMIEKFLAMAKLNEKTGMGKMRVMTDFCAERYWTIVSEIEVPSLQAFEEMMQGNQASRRR